MYGRPLSFVVPIYHSLTFCRELSYTITSRPDVPEGCRSVLTVVHDTVEINLVNSLVVVFGIPRPHHRYFRRLVAQVHSRKRRERPRLYARKQRARNYSDRRP